MKSTRKSVEKMTKVVFRRYPAVTRPAREKEYRNPLSELRAIGYDDLHIVRHARPKFINS